MVTACSPRNFDLVKDLGADLVFDYVCKHPKSRHLINRFTYSPLQKSPDVGKAIREATSSSITKIFDTVNVESSVPICAEAFGPSGGTYCNLLGLDCPRDDVESIFFLGYDMSGESYKFEGNTFPARPEALEFARKWNSAVEKLWSNGKWKPHPQRLGPRGLMGALDGMQEMREGLISAEKLVYRVDDTIWSDEL